MPRYIHELNAWPAFTWDMAALAAPLAEVSLKQGAMLGRMGQVGLRLRDEAQLDNVVREVVKSSEIEGEYLDAGSVRSSVARRLGFEYAALKQADRGVEGVVDMVLDATQNYDRPLTAERLCAWQASLFPTGRSGMHPVTVGAWRTGPVQVLSGPIGRERVHFEGPAAERLPDETQMFLRWCETESGMNPLLRAGLAHLWFVTLHPFDDGNGRVARAVADHFLVRAEKCPRRYYSMSAQIQLWRKEYYDVLEATQKRTMGVTEWLAWFLSCLDAAVTNAQTELESVLEKSRFWQTHADTQFTARQRLVVNKLLDGFEGKLTSSKWAKLTKVSQDTAHRDIVDLLAKNVLVQDEAGGRSTNYLLRR